MIGLIIKRLRSFLIPCRSLSTTGSPALRESVASLLDAKRRAGRRPVHVTNLRQYLSAFSLGRENQNIGEIKVSDIEAWLDAKHKTPAGRATGLNRLSTLFSFAVRRGWVSSNPCRQVERITVEVLPPKILSAEEAARLLEASSPPIRPWMALGLFCGLRPTEAERMTWDQIRLRDEHLVIDGAASKVRRRRVIALLPAALAWLSIDALQAGPVVSSRSTLRRSRRKAASGAGIVWSQDVLRHTYASMRVAVGASLDSTADEMGTSRRILLVHYRELVTRPEAERFWAIRPGPSLRNRGQNIVRIHEAIHKAA